MADENRVQVEPTKALFVEVLTRDISDQDAIIELVDNAVDGAKRATSNSGNYSNFEVSISLDKDHFVIKDNCGGISLELARKYAFRFGRAEGMENVGGSIGQYGVGMKRAIFSFGRECAIESATKDDWFSLNIDIEEWAKNNAWDFQLTGHGKNDGSKPIGTRIEVRKLFDEVANRFSLDSFQTKLETTVRNKHGFFILNGLLVRVCDKAVPEHKWQIIADDQFKPGIQKKNYDANGQEVRARIYAGLGNSSPTDAGWYVICNGRLLLSAEKTAKTGWDWNSTERDSETGTPRYHNQFARFRGYVLFDSANAGQLPWNTTKTDVDVDALVWQDTREIMAKMMRPVIDFLNLLSEESDLPKEERKWTHALHTARQKTVTEITESATFEYPSDPPGPRKRMTSIQFNKEKKLVDSLQEAMGASSARETGSKAFDEAYRRHVDEEA